jgi:hypothetical protein
METMDYKTNDNIKHQLANGYTPFTKPTVPKKSNK